jgi:excisionase family DNA binding protein
VERTAIEKPAVESVETAAKLLRVSERSVVNWIRSGALPSLKVGRRRLIRRSALDAFLAERENVERKLRQPKQQPKSGGKRRVA